MDVVAIDKRMKELVQNYLNLEKEILDLIIQMEQSKAFYRLGFNSLFSYLHKELKLSPAITYNFINVARKSIEVPELKEQVASGNLSIYKAQKMTSVLTKENHKQWFRFAEHKTHRELEREVAIASPKTMIKSQVKYISPEAPVKEIVKIKSNLPRVELQLGISERLMLKIRRAQDLESQRKKSNLNLEETLEEVLNLYLDKRDPVKRARRQKSRGQLRNVGKNSSQELKSQSTKNKRSSIPARIIHQVQLRYQGRCTHTNQKGERCSSRRFLEIHHINPVSKGGKNSLDNLLLLCSGHHKAHHQK